MLISGLGATEKFHAHDSILSSPRCRSLRSTTHTDTAESGNLSLRNDEFSIGPVSVLGEVPYEMSQRQRDGPFAHRKRLNPKELDRAGELRNHFVMMLFAEIVFTVLLGQRTWCLSRR